MKVSIILPYANPHVIDWVQKLNFDNINIGCIKSTQDFRPGYFKEYDNLVGVKYFFKSDLDKMYFENDLKNSDILLTLGIFNKYLLNPKLKLKSTLRLLVLSEPYNPVNSKEKSLLRKIWAKLLKIRFNRIDFLCIGGNDVKNYYIRLGFSKSSYYNFGYFPDLKFIKPHFLKENDIVKLGFIGQLIERKGIDRLIELLKVINSQGQKFLFFIAGDGKLRDLIEYELKLIDNCNIKYLGLINNKDQVENFLEKIDVLYIPSYFDGWGSVVNEAISKSCAIISTPSVYAYNALFINDYSLPTTNEEMIELIIKYLNNFNSLNEAKKISYEKQFVISCEHIASEVSNVINNNVKRNNFVHIL